MGFTGMTNERVDPEYHKPVEGVDGTDGYVGVSREYQNAANETDEPHTAPGDDPDELAELGVNNQHEYEQAVEAKKDDDDDSDDEGPASVAPPQPEKKTAAKKTASS